MDNVELIRQISESGGDTGAGAERRREAEHKFVVFLIEDKRYAFRAELVREIVINNDIYFIPFVPPYIKGLINRHGEPHSVFDLRIILDNEPLTASKLLIMNYARDHVAFLISDVVRVVSIPESGVHSMPASEEQQTFEGFISYEDSEIFIINAQDIYDRLQGDLQNA
jgi:purine-binding chemotaxis protein CheW